MILPFYMFGKFTCLERVGGEKRKEKKIFNLDI